MLNINVTYVHGKLLNLYKKDICVINVKLFGRNITMLAAYHVERAFTGSNTMCITYCILKY